MRASSPSSAGNMPVGSLPMGQESIAVVSPVSSPWPSFSERHGLHTDHPAPCTDEYDRSKDLSAVANDQ